MAKTRYTWKDIAKLKADRDALLRACKKIYEREGWVWLGDIIQQAEQD